MVVVVAGADDLAVADAPEAFRQWPLRFHPGTRWDSAMRSSQSPSRPRSARVSAVRSGSAARRVTAAAA